MSVSVSVQRDFDKVGGAVHDTQQTGDKSERTNTHRETTATCVAAQFLGRRSVRRDHGDHSRAPTGCFDVLQVCAFVNSERGEKRYDSLC